LLEDLVDPVEDLLMVMVLVTIYVDKVMRAARRLVVFLKIAVVVVELVVLAPLREQLFVPPLVVLVVLVEHRLSQVLL
jgi:hypothetical protein